MKVVSVVRDHLLHLETSAAHLRLHLQQQPEHLKVGRDTCSVRHLRKELRGATEALSTLNAALLDLDGIVAQVEDEPGYLPHWPPPEPKQKRRRWVMWLPLCLVMTSLWLYKSPGRFGYWALLPRGGSFGH